MPRESSAVQRRSAVRQPVALVPRTARIVYSGVARRPLHLGVIDISATGVNVRSRDELRAGDLLELVFDLDAQVHVHARVLRVIRRDRVWEAGCAFEGVPEHQSERIVKFVFAQQRLSLRARRGLQ